MTNGKGKGVESYSFSPVARTGASAFAQETADLIRQIEGRGFRVTSDFEDGESDSHVYRVTTDSKKLAAYIGDTVWNAIVRLAVIRKKQTLDELAVQAMIKADFQSTLYGAIHDRIPELFKAFGTSSKSRSDAFEVAFALFPHLHLEMLREVHRRTNYPLNDLCGSALRMLVPFLIGTSDVLPMHPEMGGYCYAKPFGADAVSVIEKLGFYPRAYHVAKQASLFGVQGEVFVKKIADGFLHFSDECDYDYKLPISDLYDVTRFPSRVGASFPANIDVEDEIFKLLESHEAYMDARSQDKSEKITEYLSADFAESAKCHADAKSDLKAFMELVYETKNLGYEIFTTKGIIVALVAISSFDPETKVKRKYYDELRNAHVSAYPLMQKGLSYIATSGKYSFAKV